MKPPSRLRRVCLVSLLGLCIFSAIAVVITRAWLSPLAKRKIIGVLEQNYQSRLEIHSLTVSLFPHPRAVGDALAFRSHGRTDIPPLITLRRFEAQTSWMNLLRAPRRVTAVQLQGLEIRISRGSKKPDVDSSKRSQKQPKPSFFIEKIVADGTQLEIFPKKANKQPLRFDIYRLTLTSVGADRPMRYQAQLRNAKPPGLIRASGDFGPWQAGEPGQTPVTGRYEFSNADLGVFKGISGKLASTGGFRGVLEQIEASGQTEVPDFTVKAGGHAVNLKTTFEATIDGVNGDTRLHPVTGYFGQTVVIANGGVSEVPGSKGKTVSLDAVVENGDLADVLRLGVKSDPPPMRGRISFHSKIVIPPGDRDIAEKLYLKGQFDIESGKFTTPAIQQKVSALSEHGSGRPKGNGQSDVISNLSGKFVLDDGVITFHGLTFRVPGATIRLTGTYGILTEQLDFRGTATLDAKLSETTTGVKSFLLKALDPVFKTNKAGAVIPIRITGTRQDPSFGLNLKG